jgi:hypothetical protein
VYAARVAAAYSGMQRNGQINPRLVNYRPPINELAGMVTTDLTEPIEKGDPTNPPRLDRLGQWVQANPLKGGLFSDSQEYRLNPRPRR